tara:strand:- start:472 stop:1224 length:753 start_codon:yes stop_codon:yes gene_type:complete
MSIYNTVKQLNIEQFKDAPNFNKFLEVASSTFDELDVVFSDIRILLNISTQQGVQLDLLGDIVVEKRGGRSDIDYRKALTLKIFRNTSRGFVDDVVQILTLMTDATKVVYSDNPPAAYTIYTDGSTLPANIHSIMGKLSAAGVAVLVYASSGDVPFIATEAATTTAELQDDLGNGITDDAGLQLVVNYRGSGSDDRLQQIFGGKSFGAVEVLSLVTETGATLVTDTGDELGMYDGNQTILGSGSATLAYQ